jgi:D-alanyl-D-alanine carboxypeptidase/D-alanyl-D-alanine-endopeptidase (penicillin-binding protein 4)
MTKLKQYLLGSAVFYSVLSFAQGTSFASSSVTYSSHNNEFVGRAKADVEEKTGLSAKEKLAFGIASMQTDPVLKNARWGLVIFDPKTNEVLTSYNENIPLIPASTTKLLTTETAMAYLGSRFKWITQLEYSGEIDHCRKWRSFAGQRKSRINYVQRHYHRFYLCYWRCQYYQNKRRHYRSNSCV